MRCKCWHSELLWHGSRKSSGGDSVSVERILARAAALAANYRQLHAVASLVATNLDLLAVVARLKLVAEVEPRAAARCQQKKIAVKVKSSPADAFTHIQIRKRTFDDNVQRSLAARSRRGVAIEGVSGEATAFAHDLAAGLAPIFDKRSRLVETVREHCRASARHVCKRRRRRKCDERGKEYHLVAFHCLVLLFE